MQGNNLAPTSKETTSSGATETFVALLRKGTEYNLWLKPENASTTENQYHLVVIQPPSITGSSADKVNDSVISDEGDNDAGIYGETNPITSTSTSIAGHLQMSKGDIQDSYRFNPSYSGTATIALSSGGNNVDVKVFQVVNGISTLVKSSYSSSSSENITFSVNKDYNYTVDFFVKDIVNNTAYDNYTNIAKTRYYL